VGIPLWRFFTVNVFLNYTVRQGDLQRFPGALEGYSCRQISRFHDKARQLIPVQPRHSQNRPWPGFPLLTQLIFAHDMALNYYFPSVSFLCQHKSFPAVK